MRLTLTQFLDTTPETVRAGLDSAIGRGLSAAAERLEQPADHIVLDHDDDLVRVEQGLPVLAGAEVRVSGEPRLATVEVTVPWKLDDRDGSKFRAVTILAETIGQEAQAAA